jgi:hypothetical protein
MTTLLRSGVVVVCAIGIWLAQSCFGEGADSPHLTPSQKIKDFQYLTQLISNQSPFVVLNHTRKGLDDVNALANTYIQRAAETTDDREFLRVLQEYINRIRHTGHQMIMGASLARGYAGEAQHYGIAPAAFERSKYWLGFLGYAADWHAAYSSARIGYWKGEYRFLEEYSSPETNQAAIPAGTQVIRIDGVEPNDYARRQQDKAILNFDATGSRLYLRDLLCVDPGTGVDGWRLECLLADGSHRTLDVPKRLGYAPCPPDRTMTLLELNETTGYLRLPNFSPSDRAGDERKLSSFLAGGSRWQRLIIDVRENQGGDPRFWVDSIVAPLIREPLPWTQDSVVSRDWALQHANLYPLNPTGFVELGPKGKGERVELRGLPMPGDWIAYRVTRTVSPSSQRGRIPPSPFKGKIYILIDDRSFSAADDFACMAQRTGFAKLVGTPTMGGTANLAKPTPVCLPESQVILWLELEATLTPDGGIRELTGTIPDIPLPPARVPASISREALLSDPWIRRVLQDGEEPSL